MPWALLVFEKRSRTVGELFKKLLTTTEPVTSLKSTCPWALPITMNDSYFFIKTSRYILVKVDIKFALGITQRLKREIFRSRVTWCRKQLRKLNFLFEMKFFTVIVSKIERFFIWREETAVGSLKTMFCKESLDADWG